MTRPRRLAATGLGLLAAAAVTLPVRAASAQDGGDPGTQGTGWSVEEESASASDNQISVSGVAVPPFSYAVTEVDLTVELVTPRSGCPALVDSQLYEYETPDPTSSTSTSTTTPPPEGVPFSFTVSAQCNGSYQASVVGQAISIFGSSTSDPFDVGSPQGVSIPPPNVTAIVASIGPDRRITVGWQPPSGYGEAVACQTSVGGPPDFLGYTVQRSIGDSDYATVATRDPGQQCWTDTLTASSTQGRYRYRVLARRAGADGEVTAAAASAPVATVTVGPPTSTPPATASTVPFRPPSAPSRPSGGGTGGGSATGTVPPTTTDDTFLETLPYDEDEPGELAAEVPDDADTFLDFVPSPGAGILVPFAIAECLAVWALHLRYLARRADDGF